MAEHYKVRQTDVLPDGTIIDPDTYDWGDVRLTRKQKMLIIWYTLPNQSGFLNSTEAALKAGYKKNSAYNAKYLLIKKNPKVSGLIEKFKGENIKTVVADACKKLISEKIERATYNINDFYESKTIEVEEKDDTRSVFMAAAAKSLEDIPPEKAKLIDNVEVNNSGIVTYKLPNRERETKEIFDINAKLNEEKSTGDYDVETTVDLIKENLASVKTTIRLNNQKIRENAGNYIENDKELPEFD